MDERTRRDIDKAVAATLSGAGVDQPPIVLSTILDYLDLDRGFYDLSDPGLLRRFWHRVRVEGHRLVNVVRKVKLAAVWLPEDASILVDAALPSPKRRWASMHDCMHRILDWHRCYFLGDTARTLDPLYQEHLENEANYGASALMFCGTTFTAEATDTSCGWASIQSLGRRYRNSLTTTLRRYVEFGPDIPMAGLVSTPFWHQKPDDQVTECRHFYRSGLFKERFARVTAHLLREAVDKESIMRSGGPVAEFRMPLLADDGTRHEFHVESFYNRYYLLTLFSPLEELSATRAIYPWAEI